MLRFNIVYTSDQRSIVISRQNPLFASFIVWNRRIIY